MKARSDAAMSGLFDLTGKVALVKGSSRRLGYVIAAAMIAHGATVIVSSENAEDTAAAATLGATGIPCNCLTTPQWPIWSHRQSHVSAA